MPRVVRETLISVRDLLIAWGPFFLIGVALLIAAYFLLDPNPPRHVILATGPENSAYAEFGKRYVEELKRYGIQVELRTSVGSRENLVWLRDGKQAVDLAFVQGGASETIRDNDQEHHEPVVSLGSLFFEPVWIFYRPDAIKDFSFLTQLRGKQVNIGARGSGTPGLFMRLAGANQIERDEIQRTLLSDQEAVIALLGGKLDALVLVSAPEAPFVQMLLQTPGVRLFEFAHAEAYARRYRFISPVVLPRGVAHLALDVPPRDLQLIAATTSLVAREGTHPAIIQLFVQAATRIHNGPGWIAPAAPAAIPALLARQPDRPHVGGAVLDRRRAAAGVAHGAAALPLPRALAHLPLVSQPAHHRSRARVGRAPARSTPRLDRQARRARRRHPRAARLRRRALRPALPHRPRARPPALARLTLAIPSPDHQLDPISVG